MSPFKCWGCDHYKDGEGDNICKGCNPLQIKDFSYKPEYHDPHKLENVAISTVVIDKHKCLTKREWTMLAQYTLGGFRQNEIANYHDIKQQAVSLILKRTSIRTFLSRLLRLLQKWNWLVYLLIMRRYSYWILN